MRNRDARVVEARFRTNTARLARVALAAAAALAALPAAATNLPHATPTLNGCADCHTGHSASNPNITKETCLGCHQTRYTISRPWTTSDQANLTAGTGSSHNWSASVTNAGAGSSMPADATVQSYVSAAGGNLSCSACHDPHSQANAPLDPAAPQTAGQAGRHFQRLANNQAQLCLTCHSAWNQSTAESHAYTGTARSHPVRYKDAAHTTDLTLANAGSGGGADWTYRQTPYDSAIDATVASYTGGATVTLDATRYKLATNALANWVVRFTSGPFKNVQASILSNTANVLTLSVTLPTIAAASTGIEIDRAGSGSAYDVTTTMAATASLITDTAKSWMTTGNASPTAGAGSVTILSTSAASRADVGKICTISSNTATALTLGTCQPSALSATPVANSSWAYRINWKVDGTGTTTAAGTTTTLVDGAKTLFGATASIPSVVGMQVRFKAGNFVARITGWDPATGTGTFSPARGTATASGESYFLEPAQVGVYRGKASAAGTTTSLTDSTQAWGANALVGLLVRFTKTAAASAANQDFVTRITANTATGLTFVALPAAVALNDAFEIDLDGNATNNYALGGTTPGYQTGTVVCGSCHGVHYADSDSSTYDSNPGGGTSHLLRRAAGDETCTGCHDTATHNSVGLESSKYDTWGTGFTCYTCHQPHATNNIFLIRPSIVTPNSGTRTVDFRDTTGAGASSFAAPSATLPTTQVCTVCHTRTLRSTNAAATDWSTHFQGAQCTGCHTHQGGFRGEESKGVQACHLCHDYGMRVADVGRTLPLIDARANYHHVMEQSLTTTGTPAVTGYPTVAQPTTVTTDNDKTCMQCHVDHNLFRPDMNTSLGANARGNNLRTRIGNAPPAAANQVGVNQAPADATPAWFGNYDYVSSGVGGICVSCHTNTQTKDVTNQKNPADQTVVTPSVTVSVPLADFSASAHAYNVSGGITSGGAFTVACTKCHNSELGSYQNGTFRFSLHNSVDRRLRAPLGQVALQDDHSEDFCYRCHSTFANAAAIGGTTKPAANDDWYGAVTTMNVGSQGLYDQMQKSNATYTVAASATLYLRNTGTINGVPPAEPTAYQYSSGTYTTNTFTQRDMAPTSGTTSVTTNVSTGTSAPRYDRGLQFVSPQIDNTVTIPTGSTFTLTIREYRASGTSTDYTRFTVYKWDGTTATPFNTSAAPNNFAQNATAISTTQTNRSTTFTSNQAVTLNPGDAIVADVEYYHSAGTTSLNVTYAYGNFGTDAAALALPAGTYNWRTAAPAGSGHKVASYTAIHRPNPAEETLAYISQATPSGKHVECEDCHDPHSAKFGNQTDSGTATAGTGATAIVDTAHAWPSNAWVGYYAVITSGTGAGGRSQIASNTATQLNVSPAFTTAPASGSGYAIMVKNNGGAPSAASAAGTTVLNDTAKTGATAWATNAWVGWTVSVELGAGAGQVRTITANTANQLTVGTAWTTGIDTTSRYVISRLPGVMTGVSGVDVNAWPTTVWTAPATTQYTPNAASTTALPVAAAQWQVCFKCHSGANTNLAAWSTSYTNIALEFNPNNHSTHPVVARNTQWPLAAADVQGGWAPGDVMYCTDCHGNDVTTASQGPHGSANPYILKGKWPASGSTNYTISNFATTGGLLCAQCHRITASNAVHVESSHTSYSCVTCHLRVPHGGKIWRLLLTTTAGLPARYKDASATQTIGQWGKPTSGYMTGTQCNACGQHTGTGEAW